MEKPTNSNNSNSISNALKSFKNSMDSMDSRPDNNNSTENNSKLSASDSDIQSRISSIRENIEKKIATAKEETSDKEFDTDPNTLSIGPGAPGASGAPENIGAGTSENIGAPGAGGVNNFYVIEDFLVIPNIKSNRNRILPGAPIVEVEREEEFDSPATSENKDVGYKDSDNYYIPISSITPQGGDTIEIEFEATIDINQFDLSEYANFEDDTRILNLDAEIDGNLLSQGDVVYRLFNNQTNLQFYTADDNEKNVVLQDVPQYESRGALFIAAPKPEGSDITGVSPVYRLYNESTGVHLYTIDENEKDYVVENLPNYRLEGNEGIAFYGYEEQVEGTVPLYRFYNQTLDAHFYTPSVDEREEFIASPDFRPEGKNDGIAFYIYPPSEM